MMKKTKSLFAAVFLMLAGATTVFAYDHDLANPYWNDYSLGPAYNVLTTFDATTKTQMMNAMDAWNDHIGSGAFLTYLPFGTSSTTASDDGDDTITKFAYGAAGFTARHWAYTGSNGRVDESDIEVNSSLPWANSAKPNFYDVQSSITHELGHALRIDHSNIYDDTMYHTGSMNTDYKRTPTSDDIAAGLDSYDCWNP